MYIESLNKIGGESIFKANLKHTDVKQLNIKSKFLSEIIEAWAKINYQNLDCENASVSKQILWNNSYIKNKCNTFFYIQFNSMCIANIGKKCLWPFT